jgi:hypothetical protein
MLEHKLDAANSILYLHPEGELEKEDFAKLAGVVNPYIEQHGNLAGVIVEAARFPGWDDFAAFTGHLRFVKDHHKHIKKVALVTDSAFGNLAERLGSHFIAADIKHFAAGQAEQARHWITE